MLFGEDFGYLKYEEQSKMAVIFKKACFLGAVLFSVVLFIYITINAYYFSHFEKSDELKVFKSPEIEIKTTKNIDENKIENIDKTIYDNIISGGYLKEDESKTIKQRGRVTKEINVTPKMPVVKDLDEKIILNSSDDNKSEIKIEEKKENITTNEIPKTTNNIDNKNLPKKAAARVQIAALSNQNSANKYWQSLKERHNTLLYGLEHYVTEANLGSRGIFYRLQIGDFRNQSKAEEFCQKFILQTGRTKADCIIVE